MSHDFVKLHLLKQVLRRNQVRIQRGKRNEGTRVGE